MKYLLKLLLPNEEKLAKYVADSIAKAINDSGKNELIEKYASIANDITSVQSMVTRVLADGKISPEETEEISTKLQPLFKYLLELV